MRSLDFTSKDIDTAQQLLCGCTLFAMADLNGTWLGTYWQAGNPTRFELVLLHSGNSITGSILDDSYMREARLSGEAIGRRISFLKCYFNRSFSPVNYTGKLSEDEDYMQGQWTIGNRYSGPWEARLGGEFLSLERTNMAEQNVPLLTGKQ